VVAWLCWLSLALVLAVWLLIANFSDAWWPATLLMFLPRWPWGLPLVPLALAAALLRPRLLLVLLVAGVVVAWPLMGLCLPWRTLLSGPPASFRCRVLTCNVHENPFGILTAIQETQPDIVALQDWPGHAGVTFPDDWHVRALGQFVVASRYPIRELVALEPTPRLRNMVVRATLETPVGPVRLYNLHLVTPRTALVEVRQRLWKGGESLQASSDWRREQSEAIAAWIDQGQCPFLVAGDFNTPCDSTLFGAIWSRYTDAFTEAGLGWGYTYHMNRTALRIDHILAGPGWRCRSCWVGPEVGSEHRPVLADLEWSGAPP
jgi:endonuclease/exonuclease/phosphatase (EEP) superfamily protein YafD